MSNRKRVNLNITREGRHAQTHRTVRGIETKMVEMVKVMVASSPQSYDLMTSNKTKSPRPPTIPLWMPTSE